MSLQVILADRFPRSVPITGALVERYLGTRLAQAGNGKPMPLSAR